MPSGIRREPRITNCQRCGKELLNIGNKPRKWCDALCRQDRLVPKKQKGVIGRTRRQYMKDKRAWQRAITQNEKLARGHCHDCGMTITEHTLPCIAFDHRDPQAKSFTISYELGRVTDQRLIDEMAKCDAVCHNCHALRTHANKHWSVRRD